MPLLRSVLVIVGVVGDQMANQAVDHGGDAVRRHDCIAARTGTIVMG